MCFPCVDTLVVEDNKRHNMACFTFLGHTIKQAGVLKAGLTIHAFDDERMGHHEKRVY